MQGDRSEVRRVTACGDAVELTLPAWLGPFRWYGTTRLTGPGPARQFFLAPAGEHRSIPSRLLPGARETRHPVHGRDVVVFEAPDRSDSALVVAGPHNEATTWFGGPAPDAAGLERLVGTFRFTDSPHGAALVPAPGGPAQEPDVTLVGRSERAVLVVRRSAEVRPTGWAGLTLPDGELWRAGRAVDEVHAVDEMHAADEVRAGFVPGGPHRWRYVLAGPTLGLDLVLLGPESGRAPLPMGEAQVVDGLSVLAGRWAA